MFPMKCFAEISYEYLSALRDIKYRFWSQSGVKNFIIKDLHRVVEFFRPEIFYNYDTVSIVNLLYFQ